MFTNSIFYDVIRRHHRIIHNVLTPGGVLKPIWPGPRSRHIDLFRKFWTHRRNVQGVPSPLRTHIFAPQRQEPCYGPISVAENIIRPLYNPFSKKYIFKIFTFYMKGLIRSPFQEFIFEKCEKRRIYTCLHRNAMWNGLQWRRALQRCGRRILKRSVCREIGTPNFQVPGVDCSLRLWVMTSWC